MCWPIVLTYMPHRISKSSDTAEDTPVTRSLALAVAATAEQRQEGKLHSIPKFACVTVVYASMSSFSLMSVHWRQCRRKTAENAILPHYQVWGSSPTWSHPSRAEPNLARGNGPTVCCNLYHNSFTLIAIQCPCTGRKIANMINF